MAALYLFSVWLHILAAAVWIGGMVFLALVLVPVVRRSEYKSVASSLIHKTGFRFRWLGWVCLLLLISTGFINLAFRGVEWQDLWSGYLWRVSEGRLLAVKLAATAAILLLSLLHDFFIGPRATILWQSDPDSREATRLRRQASRIGRLNLLLGLGAVFLGIVITRGWPW